MTTPKTTKPRRKPNKGFKLKPYMIVIGALIIALIVYIGFCMHNSSTHLIPLSVLALIAGVFFESRRLSDKWLTVLLTGLWAFIFSFVAFLPGKTERIYNFENHVEVWPYIFIFVFIISSIAFHKDKVIPKLTEGITLLQSIAVVYWVIDYGFIEIENLFLKSLMVIGLLFSLYSLFHAFTHTILSRTSRLILSIWSSIIILLFALDNIYSIYQNDQIENTADLTHGLYI